MIDENTILPRYFTLAQICDGINRELNLSLEEKIYPQVVWSWQRDGVVQITKKKVKPYKVDKEDYKKIKHVAFLVRKLKFPTKSIDSILHYVRTKNIEYRNNILEVVKEYSSVPEDQEKILRKIKSLYV